MDLSNPDKKILSDMGQVEQWAMVGAAMSRADIQYWLTPEGGWCDRKEALRGLYPTVTYRIKPEPTKSTREYPTRLSAADSKYCFPILSRYDASMTMPEGVVTIDFENDKPVRAVWVAD